MSTQPADLVRRLLLRLALGSSQYEYMCRTLLSDPRASTARMIDIVVRKDAVEKRWEADWIKRLARITRNSGVRPYDWPKETRYRGEWSWKRLWCWADGHGGIAWDGNGPVSNHAHPWCKRCGAPVRLVA